MQKLKNIFLSDVSQKILALPLLLHLCFCSEKYFIHDFSFDLFKKVSAITAGYGDSILQNIPSGTNLAGYSLFRRSDRKTNQYSAITARAIYIDFMEEHQPKINSSPKGILFLTLDVIGFSFEMEYKIKKKISSLGIQFQ